MIESMNDSHVVLSIWNCGGTFTTLSSNAIPSYLLIGSKLCDFVVSAMTLRSGKVRLASSNILATREK